MGDMSSFFEIFYFLATKGPGIDSLFKILKLEKNCDKIYAKMIER